MSVTRRQPEWVDVAGSYEGWYQTPRGRKYDALEKGLIAQLLGRARGRRLLDIGCGTGHFTRWFRELGWEVWGLDLEARMLAQARKLSGEDIVYSCGDAAELPFADKSFHLCVMITTLEATSCPEAALREAMRVSREKVILGILNSFSLLALFRRIRAILRPSIFSRIRFYSGPALCSMIRRVSRQSDRSVSVRIAPWVRGAFPQIPLGPFFALAIELGN
jgi:ubiquinone/menaquinone biosynthesis C-methylase UbiE